MTKLHHTQIKQSAALNFTAAVVDGRVQLTDDLDGSAPVLTGDTFKDAYEAAQAKRKAQGRLPAKLAKPKAVRPKLPTKKAKAKARKARGGDEDGDEDGDEVETASVVKPKYKAIYKPHHNSNGDDFADALRAATYDEAEQAISIEALNGVAKANEVSLAKYKNRNTGWQGRLRMTLGNILRGMQRQGTDIKIGSAKFKGLKPSKE